MCLVCHGRFDKPRTVPEYRELVSVKKTLQKQAEERELWYEYNLESDIRQIIETLSNLEETDDECKSQFSYDVRKVDQKTDASLSNLTKQKIKTNVRYYFNEVRKTFAAVDSEKLNTANIIASQVKIYYLKQKQKKFSQQEIYDNCVKWIDAKTKHRSSDACEIIVSFFIQNCEVFDDNPK